MVTLNGEVKDVETAAKDGFESLGQPSRVFTARDITERKRIQEALRASEARGTAILEGAAQGIVAADQEGKIVLVNV
jgi:PAS domain-containing protein